MLREVFARVLERFPDRSHCVAAHHSAGLSAEEWAGATAASSWRACAGSPLSATSARAGGRRAARGAEQAAGGELSVRAGHVARGGDERLSFMEGSK